MTLRSATRRFTPALLAAVSLAAAVPAHAGTFSITPARIDARVNAGTLLPAVRVRNDTSHTLLIDASVLRAGQDLGGLPTWQMTPDTLQEGRRVARISPARFVMRPHSARAVRARVLAAHPTRGRGSYGVIVFSAVPMGGSSKGSFVATRVRLAANLLLRYGGGRAGGGAEWLRPSQGPQRTIMLAVGVHNTGDLHGRPTARVHVRDAAGRIVARARFATGNVLPGAQRELTTAITRVLPAGDYEARVNVTLGGRHSTRTTRFHLVAPGTLPTPDLRIDALPVPSPSADDPVVAKVGLHNAGTAPATLEGVATIGAPGGQPRSRALIAGAPLAAGERRSIEVRLPPAGRGQHELTVRLLDDGRTVATRSVVFEPGQSIGWWARLRDWASAHVGLLLGAIGLLLLIALVAGGLLVRGALRRARAAGTAAAEPAWTTHLRDPADPPSGEPGSSADGALPISIPGGAPTTPSDSPPPSEPSDPLPTA